MSKPLFSELWYRVAALRPRLRSHVCIYRHSYRDQIWYVIQDTLSGRYHRFTPSAHFVLNLMDGKRDLHTIWEYALAALSEEAPTQDDIVQLLGQLHAADLLSSTTMPDSLEIFNRQKKQRKQKMVQRFLSPMSVRIPLFDPEKILRKGFRCVQPVLSWWGAAIWLAVVIAAAMVAGLHWSEFTNDVAATVLTPENLLLLGILFPVVKALHEFGHAFAAKIWGGEVHEMGIMLLVFMPVPYVDASAASAFRERYKRIVVGAAGMLVEVFIAALCVMVWAYSEPGLTRSMAYNVILIAGISTVVFNANPLLRFDGYYILADTIEIPNLAARANKYLAYLFQKYLFGAEGASSPASASGEEAWFIFYSIASFIYRTIIVVAIALFVASEYFIVGVLLGLFAMFNMFIYPMVKHAVFLFKSDMLHRVRIRAVSLTALSVCVLFLLVCFVPVPLWKNSQGVIWLPEKFTVRAGVDCFVKRLLVQHGDLVDRGSPVLVCENIELSAEERIVNTQIREANVRYISELRTDRVAAEQTREALKSLNADLTRIQERIEQLVVKSPTRGVLSVPLAQDLPGKYIKRGDTLAYVMDEHRVKVRAIVTQDDIGLVRERLGRIDLLFSDDTANSVAAKLAREVPGASEKLPSAALGTQGGGTIIVDPRVQDAVTSFKKNFQFDIDVPHPVRRDDFGGRVHVRFDLGREPIIYRWHRSIRQLFLAHFGV